jgi:hypothetical protein
MDDNDIRKETCQNRIWPIISSKDSNVRYILVLYKENQ